MYQVFQGLSCKWDRHIFLYIITLVDLSVFYDLDIDMKQKM